MTKFHFQVTDIDDFDATPCVHLQMNYTWCTPGDVSLGYQSRSMVFVHCPAHNILAN